MRQLGETFVHVRPQPGGGYGFFVGPGFSFDARTGYLHRKIAQTSPQYLNEEGEEDINVQGELFVAPGSRNAIRLRPLTSDKIMDSTGTTSNVADTQRRILAAIATASAQIATLQTTVAALVSSPIRARGTATLVAGTVTVLTANVTSGDLIYLQRVTPGGVIGDLTYSTIVDGVSFDINSDSALDTSTANWMVVSP
jgi:hypothetical protein